MIENSILLCTFNEGKYIKETVLNLEKNIPNLEIIIVDDNSSDDTISILDNLDTKSSLKIIKRTKTRSLGSAFQRALIESQGANIGWLDTNMSELIPNFKVMEELLNSDNDIVHLSRYIDGGIDKRNILRSLSSKYFNTCCRLILRGPVTDYTSGIFLMKRKVIDEVTFLGYGHGDFYIEFMYNAHKKGLKIKEIPFVQKKDDDFGLSKSAPNLVKFFYLGIKYFIRIFTTVLRNN